MPGAALSIVPGPAGAGVDCRQELGAHDHGIHGTGCRRQHHPIRRRQTLPVAGIADRPTGADRRCGALLPERRQSARVCVSARLHLPVRAARGCDLRRGHAQPAGGSRAGDVARQLLPRAAVLRDRPAVHAVLRGRVVHRHAFAAVVGVSRADARHRVLQQRLAPDRARARPQGGSRGSRRRPGRERARRLRPLLHRAQPRPSRARRHARGHRQLAHGRVDLQVRVARNSRRVPPRLAARARAPGKARQAGLVARATRS